MTRVLVYLHLSAMKVEMATMLMRMMMMMLITMIVVIKPFEFNMVARTDKQFL